MNILKMKRYNSPAIPHYISVIKQKSEDQNSYYF